MPNIQITKTVQSNVDYTLFTAHPVLGTVMAEVATRDIKAGEEILVNYAYPDKELYKFYGINLEEHDIKTGGCNQRGPSTEDSAVRRIENWYKS